MLQKFDLMRFRLSAFPILVISMVFVPGCTSQLKPDDLPKLYSVKIRITQENKPVPGTQVSLVPLDPSSKWGAGGVTEADGYASPNTHGVYKGVAAGAYKVVVSRTWTDYSVTERKGGETVINPCYDLIDPEYGKPETTPLEITIEGKFQESFEVGPEIKKRIPYIE